MKRIHGSCHNERKIHIRDGEGFLHRRQLRELKSKLLQAVAEEAFEEAAVLRDEIKRLSAEKEE